MTKHLIAAAALVLASATSISAAPAPTATTLYLQGPSATGEVDGALWLSTLTFSPEAPMRMDATAPTDARGTSTSYPSVVNDQCPGTPPYPTFPARMTGRIEGTPSLSLHFLGAPGKIRLTCRPLKGAAGSS